mgnify:FL=1
MSGIGHNRGPSLAGGASWRTHCWTVARAELLPTLPVEVVRLRVRRAKEIGLDYKTYAGVRAATGHDIVAFLFSTNALQLLRDSDRLPPEVASRLAALRNAGRIVAVHPPLDPARTAASLAAAGAAPEAAARAPQVSDNWARTRTVLTGLLGAARRAPDQVLLIGDTALERDWCAAGRLAGYLPAERYFGAPGR